MTNFRRTLFFASSFFVCLAALSSCRTSQQESRRATASRAANGTPAVTRQMDSLLLIEQKLIEVIDSMAGLVDADHSRIRTLEAEVRALQSGGMPASAPLPPANSYPSNGADPPSAPANTSTAPLSFQDRYTIALQFFNDENYESALDQFQSLEKDDPAGPYASNYKYWEGECYFGEKRYNQALQTFGKVLEQYPSSSKAAAAEFKTGECYERMKIPASARMAYERVLADYPNSEYRARAQSRLKALKISKDL